MKITLNQDQRGIGPIVEIIFVAVVLVAVSGIGYLAYKAKSNTTKLTSFHGTVKQNNCTNGGSDCASQTLNADNGKSYGLVGPIDVKLYVGKSVTVKGTVASSTPTAPIEVVAVQPDTPPATLKGTLSIKVYCGRLNYQEPCASAIQLANHGSGQGNIDPYAPTDASGYLSISLAAGKYDLTPQTKPDYPEFTPPISNPVTVTAGQTTDVTINYHDLTK